MKRNKILVVAGIVSVVFFISIFALGIRNDYIEQNLQNFNIQEEKETKFLSDDEAVYNENDNDEDGNLNKDLNLPEISESSVYDKDYLEQNNNEDKIDTDNSNINYSELHDKYIDQSSRNIHADNKENDVCQDRSKENQKYSLKSSSENVDQRNNDDVIEMPEI